MGNKSILVIEDNDLNMKLVRGLLAIGQYTIMEAFDAESGIQMAREHHPDLILMDIQLPGMKISYTFNLTPPNNIFSYLALTMPWILLLAYSISRRKLFKDAL